MKQPKRLTRDQKVILSAQGLVVDNYMLEKETEFYLVVVHKSTGKSRRIDKYAGGKYK